MELIIQEIMQKVISHCEKGLEELIMKKIDISGFIMNTKKMLDDVGKIIVADTLETINEIYRNSKERKRDWTIKEKANEKAYGTIFGEIRYERTYYQNKKTGEYSYRCV